MPGPLSGPGVGLQIPQFLYPSELGAPIGPDAGTPEIVLAPGNEIPIPPGTWYVGCGMYSVIEWLDPISNIWKIVAASLSGMAGAAYVKSDGSNYRVANRTACPIGGVVTAAGSSYVQASTTISVTGGGGSLWAPIVGGAVTSLSITNFGAGYGVAPMLIIQAPQPPAANPNGVGGICASGWCNISSGTLNGATLTNQGAGYQTAPVVKVVPNPTDPNLSTGITNALITALIGQSGSLTGVLCTNAGAPLSNPANITLSVSGAGSTGTVVAVMLQTVTSASVTGAGTGFGNATTIVGTGAGGSYPTGTIALSPEKLGLKARPRPAQFTFTTTGTGGSIAAQGGLIIDGGLYFNTAIPNIMLGSAAGQVAAAGSISGPTIALTMGSSNDVITLQPAP